MKRVILVALASLLVASSALAVVVPDEGEDSLGLYFDNAGVMENTTTATMAEQVPFYIVLAGVSAPSVAAWELSLDWVGGSVILDPGLPPDGVNFATVPMYIVGLGTPVPPDADGNLVLAMPVIMVLDEVVDFYAGPSTPATLDPPRPAYANGADLSDIRPMDYSVDANGQHVDDDGWCTLVIASINGEAAVATEDATWSSVKGMYR